MSYTKYVSELLEIKYYQEHDIGYHANTTIHVIDLDCQSNQYRKWLYGLEGQKCIFFEDEWVRKTDICLSIIANKIGYTPNRVYARKCIFKKIPPRTANIFFDKNHISGKAQASYAYGLFNDNELVSALSLRRPFSSKYKNTLEIARFSSLKNTSVVGGLSKLIKNMSIDINCEQILTYADRRFGEGYSYRNAGFTLIDSTEQDYFYTDKVNRFNRFKFRAQNGLTEKQVAEKHGVHKVFGCGSMIYIKKI